MNKHYLPCEVRTKGLSMVTALLIVLSLLLLPSQSSSLFAQAVNPACINDSGVAVIPSAGAGVGGWLLLLNFNHAASATNTVGCLITTTQVNPQRVSRILVNCQIVNNQSAVLVGNGTSPFDGKFSVSCPGLGMGKTKHENFTVWGRATFNNRNVNYSITQHSDFSFIARLNTGWKVNFTSRYGANSFNSGNPNFNLAGQLVSFTSALRGGTASHFLNSAQLTPLSTLPPFDFHQDQPFTISGPGQLWTLHELIIDPPGGCCTA